MCPQWSMTVGSRCPLAAELGSPLTRRAAVAALPVEPDLLADE
jgi:hypothetical protein